MIENSQPLKKQQELRDKIERGEYKTLIDIIVAGVGRFIQKLTKNPKPIPSWYSIVIIALFSLLIDLLTSILLGEFHPFRRQLLLLDIWGPFSIIAVMTLAKVTVSTFLTTLRESTLAAIESEKDLDDFQSWLAASFDIKKPLIIGSILTLTNIIIPLSGAVKVLGGFPGLGYLILNTIWSFLIAVTAYYLLIILVLFIRLGHYRFKLYPGDPSHSEVIDRLSDTLNNILYMIAIYTTLWTLGIVLLTEGDTINTALLILGWGSLIIMFVSIQYTLGNIITKAKWKTLNEIQTKIETLQAQNEIPTKDTLGHIAALMDYHDRIRATRNSALDVRSGLSFLNSLLLPLVAFILANWDKIVAFFSE